MKKCLILVVSCLSLLVLLAACSTEKEPALLRLITEEFPPFNFSQEGQFIGQSTEIVTEIVKKTGDSVSFEIMNWSEGYALAQKENNAVLYSTARIEEREKLFKWAGPIGTEENNFYVRKDAAISVKSLEEAKKIKSIAVYRNDSNHLYLASQGFTNLDISANDGECLQKLIDGKAEMWLGPARSLPYIAARLGADVNSIKPVMHVRSIDWHIAFNKHIPDSMVEKWQNALDAIKQKDSTGSSPYERIIQKHSAPR